MEQKSIRQPHLDDETLSLEELANRQGVKPVLNIAELMGAPSPEDESLEEFAAMLRGWRSEGSRSPRQQ